MIWMLRGGLGRPSEDDAGCDEGTGEGKGGEVFRRESPCVPTIQGGSGVCGPEDAEAEVEAS